jgi:hypothetical protein
VATAVIQVLRLHQVVVAAVVRVETHLLLRQLHPRRERLAVISSMARLQVVAGVVVQTVLQVQTAVAVEAVVVEQT